MRRDIRSDNYRMILYIHFENYINAGSRTKENKACDSWILDANCDYDFHICVGDENNPCSYEDIKFGTYQDALPILYFNHEMDITLKLTRARVSYRKRFL